MFFKKNLAPAPCHFRQFVTVKESWPNVWKRLEFRPKTTHVDLRKQCIDAATESAIKSSYLLLAVELFNLATEKNRRLHPLCGEEPIILECLAFSSSFICNLINPESEDYELYLNARQSTIESFSLMSLLDHEDVENTLLTRFEMYDKASISTDREEFLSDTLARILTYLSSGEQFTRIKIRYEDPANIAYRLVAQEFISNAIPKLKEMVNLIVKREMDEENDLDEEVEDFRENLDEIEISAKWYHEQIDKQIASISNFLKDRFGGKNQANFNGQYSLQTLAVFTAHAATLLAAKQDFPDLHRSILNGFTRTLSFLTPNTMPEVNQPDGALVSYCSNEESFMHNQTDVFDRHGMEPLVRNLVRQLGGNESDFAILSKHIELAARHATRTYLPRLIEN